MSEGVPPTHSRLALVGVGRMGEAVLSGLLRAGWPTDRLVAVEPHPDQSARVRDEFGVSVEDLQVAAAQAEVIVIAVKPQQVLGVLTEVGPVLGEGALVVSLAAGLPLALLEANLPAGTAVIRVMPNTPALVGEGMSVMSAGAACTDQQLGTARELLGTLGRVAQVPDYQQDAVTAVSGSGPAYVFYLLEAMADAGVMLGLTRPLAAELAAQTVLGAATMVIQTGERPGVLRENVTSPGGTTAAALHTLDEHAVKAAVANAMRACRDRSAELAAGL